MSGYKMKGNGNHTLKVILIVKEGSPLIKVIEFYLNVGRCSLNDSQNRLLTVTGDRYELMVGNKSAMYGFSGVGIRKWIEKRISQRQVALISSQERVEVIGLEKFLLSIICPGEIRESVKSSINLFARGKL